jgi:hypothetical protein
MYAQEGLRPKIISFYTAISHHKYIEQYGCMYS